MMISKIGQKLLNLEENGLKRKKNRKKTFTYVSDHPLYNHFIAKHKWNNAFPFLPSIYLSIPLLSPLSMSGTMEDMRRNQLSELGCIVEATGRTGASFSNPCCGLEIHPIRETNLGCGMKQSSTSECFPSFPLFCLCLSFFLSLSCIYSRQCHASCHLLLCVCVCMYTYMRSLTRIAKLLRRFNMLDVNAVFTTWQTAW